MTPEQVDRYLSQARSLSADLAEIKVAEPHAAPPPHHHAHGGGLARIAAGETALASMPAQRAAAESAAVGDLQRAAVKERLRRLLDSKDKTASQQLLHVKAAGRKLAEGTSGFVLPSEMTRGADTPSSEEQPSQDTRGAHQGPAANLLAAQLRESRKGGEGHELPRR